MRKNSWEALGFMMWTPWLFVTGFTLLGPASLAEPFPVEFEIARVFDFPGASNAATRFRVGDFNGDGSLDVVTDRSYRYGDGDGGFGALRLSNIGSRFHTADFTEDGFDDVIYTVNNDLFLLRGRSQPGFLPPVELFFPGVTPRSLGAGDINEDGHLDIIVARSTPPEAKLAVLFNDGTGSITAVNQFDVNPNVFEVVAGDLDEDGHLDVLAMTRDEITVFWGRGTTILEEGETLLPFRAFDDPATLEVADLDGDGNLDVAVALSARPAVLVARGNGSRSLLPPVEFDPGLRPVGLALGDVNNDGRLDMVTHDERRVSVLRKRRGFSFHPPVFLFTNGKTTHEVHDDEDEIELADIDNDGRLDLLVLSPIPDSLLSIHRGDGRGSFASAPQASIDDPLEPRTADFDLDGHLDVAVTQTATQNLHVVLGDGNGGLGAVRTFPVGHRRDSLDIADLDGNGFPDVVTADEAIASVSILLGRQQQGVWGFDAVSTLPVGGLPVSVTALDVSDDQVADLIVQMNQDLWEVYLGDGLGDFNFFQQLSLESVPETPAVADLDGNGHEDLIVVAALPDVPVGLVSLSSDGSGTLTPVFLAGVPRGKKAFASDFNQDGHPDVAVTFISSFSETWFRTYLGDSQGALAFHDQFIIHPLNRFALGDLNEDGNPDLIAGQPQQSSFFVLCGEGNGDFGPNVRFGTPSFFRSTVADMDGDGHQDLVVSNSGLNRSHVAVVRNSKFDFLECRSGTVNASVGPPVDVLFANNSPGIGPEREVRLVREDPLALRIEQPPAEPPGTTDYVLYLALGDPRPADVSRLPFGVGRMCLISPPNGVVPDLVANTLGFTPLLASTNWPVPIQPAPSQLVGVNEVGVRVRFRLQGLIIDSNAALGISVTNALVVIVE